jgi:hypothetical protein
MSKPQFIRKSRFREELDKYRKETRSRKDSADSDKSSGNNMRWFKRHSSAILSRFSSPQTPKYSPSLKTSHVRFTPPKTRDQSPIKSFEPTALTPYQEIEKWKEFGSLMADSYEKMKKKYLESIKMQEEQKRNIRELNEQLNKLNTLQARVSKEKEEMVTRFQKEIQVLRIELEETNRERTPMEYSQMADEIIHLRTELERRKSSVSRLQRDQVNNSLHKNLRENLGRSASPYRRDSGVIMSLLDQYSTDISKLVS